MSSLEALTGNAKFPSPSPTLAILAALLKTLRDAIASTGAGRAEAIAAARDTLTTALTTLASSLVATPGVTEADLATTGFDLPKPHARTSGTR